MSNPHYRFNYDYEKREPMEWVTPITTYNRHESTYATDEKYRVYSIDTDACMIVRIGKAEDRLAYPTAAQVKKAYRKGGFEPNYD